MFPWAESNPVEIVKNNVFGTLHLVEAVRESGVPRLVLISTDKAVEPRYVYGASQSLSPRNWLSPGTTENQHFMVVPFRGMFWTAGEASYPSLKSRSSKEDR
ncbi:polysaccharide biosynthesis protein [Marispirochaeta sp.]|uniref:polysaccharide biosynthesis protein n=1 Tax=Marispirochaeta sp. TaxID=2038653 RepID=UPI0029C6B110|nr:polysaccharide biosynthesis protein [Marispirochaeta sp.]